MMYIIYNADGSIKKVNLTDFIMQGDSGTKIYVSIDGLTDETRDNYTVSVQWKIPNGEVIGPVPCSYKASQDAFEVVIDEAETLYEGILLGSIVLIDLLSNIKYTYPAKFVINPSTFEPSEETNITTLQYANLLNYIKTHGMEIVEINKDKTLLDLWNLIGNTLTFVRVSGNGTFLFSLALPQQGQTDEINFEAEKYAGGITAGQDRFSGTAVPSDTVLNDLLKSSGEYFRPYLVTNVPFDLVNNPELTLADIYARISNKAAIIRLIAIDEWAGINGFYLIKMEKIDDSYTIEAERIGMGNAPTVSSASYRFIGTEVNPETYIVTFFDPDNEFYAPYAELKEMPTNLENGSGTYSVQMKQDVTSGSGTFDFTNKNPNATATDPTLTGQITYGATGEFATAFGGKNQASGKRSLTQGTTTVAKGAYSHAEGDNCVALGPESHAEGTTTLAIGPASHSEGSLTVAREVSSHAEGFTTYADGVYTHAEGVLNKVKGDNAHAEGANNTVGSYSGGGGGGGDTPTPGQYVNEEGACSHAEGAGNVITGKVSHAEGQQNTISGNISHAEGALNTVSGESAHVEGIRNNANYDYQHVSGRWNDNKSDTLFEIGNGTAENARSNAFEVYQNGILGIPNFDANGNRIGTKKIKCVNGVLTVID